jgi:hypothetical protein
MNNRIILPETDNYYLLKDPIKGICLIANKQYEINDIITTNYIAEIDWVMDNGSKFQREYPMYWTDEKACIAFGVANLINHSKFANCKLLIDIEQRTLSLICISEIKIGVEIVMDYGNEHYPFKSGETDIMD